METPTVDTGSAFASSEAADFLLRGRRILIVEDEALVSLHLEAMLNDMGCTVAGRAADLQAALAQVQEATYDAVVLDLNLHGTRAESVAEALASKGTPFVIATGYDEGALDMPCPSVPVVRKPYLAADVRSALVSCLRREPLR